MPLAKLTPRQVLEINHYKGKAPKEIALIYGVNKKTVKEIQDGAAWRSVTAGSSPPSSFSTAPIEATPGEHLNRLPPEERAKMIRLPEVTFLNRRFQWEGA